MRVLARGGVQLDMVVGSTALKDHFEWELAESAAQPPESFALRMCADLGLGSEHAPIVAHSIREQVLARKKELLEVGSSGYVLFTELTAATVLRTADGGNEWGPVVERLSAQDLDRLQQARDREARRLRRETRRGTARTVASQRSGKAAFIGQGPSAPFLRRPRRNRYGRRRDGFAPHAARSRRACAGSLGSPCDAAGQR